MKMKLLSAAVLAGLFSASVQAATFDQSGSIANVSEVYQGWFVVDNSLDDAGVTLSTSSWANNNFDPFLAVWALDGTLLWYNDDNDKDGVSDSYINAGVMADGKYYFTLSNNPNIPTSLNVGTTNLSDGFFLSDTVANPNDVQPYRWGHEWNLQITGVTEVGVVPEPETWAMLLVGLGLVGAVARRRKQQ